MTRRSFRSALLPAIALLAWSTLATAQPATEPDSREGWWMKMHESFLERAKQGDVDLLFLGDSITQGWNGRDQQTGEGPREVWDRHFGPRKAANFGIGGDRTQHILWRLDHGEVEGIAPKVAVLMIGTNNVGTNSADEIAAGVAAILDRLKEKLPETKVVLLAVFPRGAKRDPEAESVPTDARIGEINERLAKMGDGERVHYVDIDEAFLSEDGTIAKEIMPDFLHLSRKGYRRWADALEPKLWELLDEPKVAAAAQ